MSPLDTQENRKESQEAKQFSCNGIREEEEEEEEDKKKDNPTTTTTKAAQNQQNIHFRSQSLLTPL